MGFGDLEALQQAVALNQGYSQEERPLDIPVQQNWRPDMVSHRILEHRPHALLLSGVIWEGCSIAQPNFFGVMSIPPRRRSMTGLGRRNGMEHFSATGIDAFI